MRMKILTLALFLFAFHLVEAATLRVDIQDPTATRPDTSNPHACIQGWASANPGVVYWGGSSFLQVSQDTPDTLKVIGQANVQARNQDCAQEYSSIVASDIQPSCQVLRVTIVPGQGETAGQIAIMGLETIISGTANAGGLGDSEDKNGKADYLTYVQWGDQTLEWKDVSVRHISSSPFDVESSEALGGGSLYWQFVAEVGESYDVYIHKEAKCRTSDDLSGASCVILSNGEYIFSINAVLP